MRGRRSRARGDAGHLRLLVGFGATADSLTLQINAATTTPVPEPASMTLLVTGLAGPRCPALAASTRAIVTSQIVGSHAGRPLSDGPSCVRMQFSPVPDPLAIERHDTRSAIASGVARPHPRQRPQLRLRSNHTRGILPLSRAVSACQSCSALGRSVTTDTVGQKRARASAPAKTFVPRVVSRMAGRHSWQQSHSHDLDDPHAVETTEVLNGPSPEPERALDQHHESRF